MKLLARSPWLLVPVALLLAILTASLVSPDTAVAGEAADAPSAQPPTDGAPADDSSKPQDTRVSLAALKEGDISSTPGQRLQSMLGMVVLLGVCWLMSNARSKISWRVVFWGIGLQLGLGVFVIHSAAGKWLFGVLNTLFVNLMSYTTDGASFLFGDLAKVNNLAVGSGGPFGDVTTGGGQVAQVGAYFAFGVLPTIIFFSSLMAVLYHIGVMQLLVKATAWVMQRTMGTSGSETLSASGNIFVGQTEAPLLVRPFVKGMTESELMAVMTGGFATVAGGVMAAYVFMLKPYFNDIAGHLLSASIMSAPAALVCAKLIIPEPDPEASETYGELKVSLESTDVNLIDAAARGAGDGLKLALNVGAMLLAFLVLIAMVNGMLGWLGSLEWIASLLSWFGMEEPLTLQLLLGKVLQPVAWLMGVPWSDCEAVGRLIGVKTVVNEFVAYLDLSAMLASGSLQNPRSVVIAIYALCGFANFGSIAIQIGGIGGIAPERRHDLARVGMRAMIGGAIACLLTACVAGILI